jgi:uncharacterized protein (TIGR01319 family)
MTLDLLVLEVGSTITKATGFRRSGAGLLEHVAQGFAPTSVAAGDVGLGVDAALADLRATSGEATEGAEVFVSSSAAGGLRMTVHGLTKGMTARAAREAALGAGAIVTLVTAGALGQADLDRVRELDPSMVLLAGGVDHGEQAVVLHNARALASAGLRAPVLFAGNVAVRGSVRRIFDDAGVELSIADNVFPDIDELAVEPVRALIHEQFNRHIVHAPGMARLAALSQWPILPTPGAVLRAAELFAEAVADCLVVDVGGATTDVHSVTEGSTGWAALAADPEPHAKRTVEGDLGVFRNAASIVALAGRADWESRLVDLRATPRTQREQSLTRDLCAVAATLAVRRHAGVVSDVHTPTGRRQVVHGRDLTAVRWVVGTGGALTRVPGGRETLRSLCLGPGRHLLPPPDARILLDGDYRFSALGTLAQAHPDEARATLGRWVEVEQAAGRADIAGTTPD